MLLLKYRTYNRGATAQTLSAGGLGLVAPGGNPGKIKWPELGVTIQNAIEAHKNRPFRWETQISPVPTYGITGHHLVPSNPHAR